MKYQSNNNYIGWKRNYKLNYDNDVCQSTNLKDDA